MTTIFHTLLESLTCDMLRELIVCTKRKKKNEMIEIIISNYSGIPIENAIAIFLKTVTTIHIDRICDKLHITNNNIRGILEWVTSKTTEIISIDDIEKIKDSLSIDDIKTKTIDILIQLMHDEEKIKSLMANLGMDIDLTNPENFGLLCQAVFNNIIPFTLTYGIHREKIEDTDEILSDEIVIFEMEKLCRKHPIKKQKRKAVPQIIRRQLWDKYGDKLEHCPICQITELDPYTFECGHVVSVKNRGTYEIDNFRIICGHCNKSMGGTNMDEWIVEYCTNPESILRHLELLLV